MAPYFVLYIFLLVLTIFDFFPKKNTKILGTFFSFPLVAIFVGLRDETGSDWKFYNQYYHEVLSGIKTYSFEFEPGFEMIVALSSSLDFTFNTFILVFSFVCIVLAYRLSWKLSRPNIFIFLFFSLFVIEMLGTLRQFIAVLIVAPLAVMIVQNRRSTFIPYYGNLGFASLFHTSALAMITISWINKLSSLGVSKKIFILSTALLAATVLNLYSEKFIGIFTFSEYLHTKLIAYVLSESNTPIFYVEDTFIKVRMFIYRLIMLSLVMLLFLSDKRNVLLRLLFAIDVAGFFIFAGLYFTFPAIAVRLGVYFTFFELLAFASFRKITPSVFFVLFLLVVLSFLSIHSTLTGADSDLLVPYKAIWYNENVERVLR